MSQQVKLGSYVLYGKTGVCMVQEKKIVVMGRDKSEYYVLYPVSDGRSSVFVPCANQQLVDKMCPLLSRDEIEVLLSDADSQRLEWLEDRNQRIAFYRSVMCGNDRRMLIRLIICLYRKKYQRQEQGKRLSAVDETTLQECMRLIEEEFSIVLDIPRAQVSDYIMERI